MMESTVSNATALKDLEAICVKMTSMSVHPTLASMEPHAMIMSTHTLVLAQEDFLEPDVKPMTRTALKVLA